MRADDVAIEAPCSEDWDRMRPEAGAQRRWCEQCERHVHDLSKMSERAARAFLRETAERDVCIAYVEDEAGELVFAPQPRIVPLARLASAATISMMLAACTPHGEPERAPRVELPESSSTVAPSSVIPCNTDTPTSGPASEASEPRSQAPREPRLVKGERKRTMGKPIKFHSPDGPL
jgi:hypothetical protein